MAIDSFDKVFTFTRPDGTKIQLRGFGDQNDAVFETLDGLREKSRSRQSRRM
jgi:hypothetical protein